MMQATREEAAAHGVNEKSLGEHGWAGSMARRFERFLARHGERLGYPAGYPNDSEVEPSLELVRSFVDYCASGAARVNFSCVSIAVRPRGQLSCSGTPKANVQRPASPAERGDAKGYPHSRRGDGPVQWTSQRPGSERRRPLASRPLSMSGRLNPITGAWANGVPIDVDSRDQSATRCYWHQDGGRGRVDGHVQEDDGDGSPEGGRPLEVPAAQPRRRSPSRLNLLQQIVRGGRRRAPGIPPAVEKGEV